MHFNMIDIKNDQPINNLDDNTNLPNRHFINTELENYVLNKCFLSYALILFDIDDFKLISDTINYITGNYIIKETSLRIKSNLTKNCILCHPEIDRFLIITPDIDNIESLVENINKSIQLPFHPINHEFKGELFITASMGVYINNNCSDSLFQCIQYADIALNKAKINGKNGLYFFNQAMKDDLVKRSSIIYHLRSAIRNDELSVYYQPKVSLKTNKIIGLEALLRWNSKELGWISPAEFIPLADESNLIISIGKYVIKAVCRQISIWKQSNLSLSCIPVSINVSPKQFKDKDLINDIIHALEDTKVSPECIEIEITEDTAIDNIEHTQKVLTELSNLGIKISIDDFGTGYSSYMHICNLPINTLKIDKSFMDYVSVNKKNRLVVENIINFAHIIDLDVVAEGIEEQNQLQILNNYGCDSVQGFYFSKPLCTSDLEKLIKSGKF